MPAEMRLTFIVALIAMALLFTTRWTLELTAKRAALQLRRLRRLLESGAGPDRQAAAAAAPRVPTVPPSPASR
jgi:hypothetical protein